MERHFNESEWIRLILLLSDTQSWLNELSISAITQVPIQDKKKLFRTTYYITISSLKVLRMCARICVRLAPARERLLLYSPFFQKYSDRHAWNVS